MRVKFSSYCHLKRSISGVRVFDGRRSPWWYGRCAGQAVEHEPRIVRVEVPVVVPCRTDEVAMPPWAARKPAERRTARR